jgi:hypothetical protein
MIIMGKTIFAYEETLRFPSSVVFPIFVLHLVQFFLPHTFPTVFIFLPVFIYLFIYSPLYVFYSYFSS